MPFPISFRGAFNYSTVGEAPSSATVVADCIERAVRALSARDVERIGNTLNFTGPSLWTASKTNPLGIIAHGEVEVDPPPVGGLRGSVRYEFQTTKGLAVFAGGAVALELYVRAVGGVRLPALASPGLAVGLFWAFEYTVAWRRVPMLLMRAAAGELEPAGGPARLAVHRDAAT